MTAWSEGTLTGLDTESTGVNPLEDRIVTAAFVMAKPGQRPRAMQVEVPVVAHNAVFDLTLLDSELGRYGIDPLATRPTNVRGVVDPMVIEKQFDTYRKVCQKAPGCDPVAKVHQCGGCRGGKWKCGGCGATDKTLASLCLHYGVPLVGAHDAAADALAAVRLARRLGTLWPSVGRWKLGTLHEHEVTWKREQSDSLRAFWKKNGDERYVEVSSEWPLMSTPESVPA